MLYKNSLRLTIKEIADIKEGKKSLDELNKNHDYSGMTASLPTRVKGTLYKFNQRHRDSKYMYGAIIDDKGNILSEKEGDKKNPEYEWTDEMREKRKNREQFHRTYNQIENEGYGVCLTYPEITNMYKSGWVHNSEDVSYPWKSISVEGSNGSRMSIVCVDENKLRNSMGWEDENGIMQKLSANLTGRNGTYTQFVKECNESTDKHMEKYTENAKNNGVNIKSKTFQKQYNEEKYNYQMEYSKENMEKKLSSNFKEFEKYGLELNIGWLK